MRLPPSAIRANGPQRNGGQGGPSGHREAARGVLDGRVSGGHRRVGRRRAVPRSARCKHSPAIQGAARPSPAVSRKSARLQAEPIDLPSRRAEPRRLGQSHSMSPARAVRALGRPQTQVRTGARAGRAPEHGADPKPSRFVAHHGTQVGCERGEDPRCEGGFTVARSTQRS